MFLTDVLTLSAGTLITLILIHLAIFWVFKSQPTAPQVVYVQAPPQQPAPPPQQHVTFAQHPEFTQSTNVPTMEPQVQMPPAALELPKRHGE